MFETSYIILELLNKADRISGRKKLQKTLHLLQLHGINVPFAYEYHFYGPYSSQLQAEVNHLVEQGLLLEENIGETYCYELTKSGRKFKNLVEDMLSIRIDLDNDLINTIEHQSASFLEVVSTFGFLTDLGYDKNEARDKCLELKPHLKSLLDDAIDFFYEHIMN